MNNKFQQISGLLSATVVAIYKKNRKLLSIYQSKTLQAAVVVVVIVVVRLGILRAYLFCYIQTEFITSELLFQGGFAWI